jgi:DNA-binding winged helix-turn-helix (wHTH) protein
VQFLFANHTLDIKRRELRRGVTPIAVEPQVFDLLACLVQNSSRVVSRADLIASVWGGRIVADATLHMSGEQAQDYSPTASAVFGLFDE